MVCFVNWRITGSLFRPVIDTAVAASTLKGEPGFSSRTIAARREIPREEFQANSLPPDTETDDKFTSCGSAVTLMIRLLVAVSAVRYRYGPNQWSASSPMPRQKLVAGVNISASRASSGRQGARNSHRGIVDPGPFAERTSQGLPSVRCRQGPSG